MYYDKKLFTDAIEQIDFSTSTPLKRDVLSALSINELKVVILGQDPYPGKGIANGNAFAVNKDVKIPPSLRNIFMEIKEVLGVVKTDRTLKSWQKQGVLLLNTSLTTQIGKPNAHKNIWKDFIHDLIKSLDDKNIIWVLWGGEAKKYKNIISSKKIIMDAHPSPLSYRKRNKKTFKLLSEWTDIEW